MYLDRSKEPLLLPRTTFEKVGQSHRKIAQVITRAWNDTAYAADFMLDNGRKSHVLDYRDRDVVDFGNVMKTVRFLEGGTHHVMLLGQTAWNIIADINNRDLRPHDPDYLISWSEPVHHNFRNGEYRRQRAAERLAESYALLAET